MKILKIYPYNALNDVTNNYVMIVHCIRYQQHTLLFKVKLKGTLSYLFTKSKILSETCIHRSDFKISLSHTVHVNIGF